MVSTSVVAAPLENSPRVSFNSRGVTSSVYGIADWFSSVPVTCGGILLLMGEGEELGLSWVLSIASNRGCMVGGTCFGEGGGVKWEIALGEGLVNIWPSDSYVPWCVSLWLTTWSFCEDSWGVCSGWDISICCEEVTTVVSCCLCVATGFSSGISSSRDLF